MSVKLLDVNTINKIAAGEVVERPASVVKELVENAIDAKATRIEVEILNGGKNFIKVSDNGVGMNREDASLAIRSHATSKLSSATDLMNVSTLGFRGEALPTIASVSQFSMWTRPEGSELGTLIRLTGGRDQIIEPQGCALGTTVLVEDLFFNVPARKKFLKSTPTEANKISDYITKLALSRPSIAFKLVNGKKLTLNTPGSGNLLECVESIYGHEIATALLQIEYKDRVDESFRISGLITKPNVIRSYRSCQTFIVNGRVIGSRSISKAVEEAYKTLIPKGAYPLIVMSIEISPSNVDVNVHPQKAEVRFEDDSQIYRAVHWAVTQAVENRHYAVKGSADPLERIAASTGAAEAETSSKTATSETFADELDPIDQKKKAASPIPSRQSDPFADELDPIDPKKKSAPESPLEAAAAGVEAPPPSLSRQNDRKDAEEKSSAATRGSAAFDPFADELDPIETKKEATSPSLSRRNDRKEAEEKSSEAPRGSADFDPFADELDPIETKKEAPSSSLSRQNDRKEAEEKSLSAPRGSADFDPFADELDPIETKKEAPSSSLSRQNDRKDAEEKDSAAPRGAATSDPFADELDPIETKKEAPSSSLSRQNDRKDAEEKSLSAPLGAADFDPFSFDQSSAATSSLEAAAAGVEAPPPIPSSQNDRKEAEEKSLSAPRGSAAFDPFADELDPIETKKKATAESPLEASARAVEEPSLSLSSRNDRKGTDEKSLSAPRGAADFDPFADELDPIETKKETSSPSLSSQNDRKGAEEKDSAAPRGAATSDPFADELDPIDPKKKSAPESSLEAAAAGVEAPPPIFPSEPELFSSTPLNKKIFPIGQIAQCYIVAKDDDGLYLVDQHAAHERIIFDRLSGCTDGVPAQQLLVSQPIDFDERERQLVADNLELFRQLGFALELGDDEHYHLLEIPVDVADADAENMLREILSSLPEIDDSFGDDEQQRRVIAKNIRESCLAMTACKAAIKAGQELNTRQMQIILEELSRTKFPFTCPHGRPTILKFDSNDLSKMFKRTGFNLPKGD